MTLRCQTIESLPRHPARFSQRVGIVIPAHDEAEHIADVIERCRELSPAAVVVVDDASSDATADVLARVCDDVTVRFLKNPQNLGKQGSVRAGLRALLDGTHGALDVVACIDGDGQHDPAELPGLAALLGEGRVDMVIGARSHDEMPLQRRFSNWLVNTGFRTIAGVDFVDVQSGLRLYSAELAAVLAERLPSEGGYGLEHESLSVLARYAQERGATLDVAAAPVSCGYGVAASGIDAEAVLALAAATVAQALRVRRAARRARRGAR